jgi:type I restriction enzyme, S subunit
MTEGGDIDKLGRGTVWNDEIPGCLHQNHVFAVRTRDELEPRYLALVTRSSLARRYFEMTATRSTNLASTNSSKVRAFRFPVPALAEQARIVSEATALLQTLWVSRQELMAMRQGLVQYRDALITEAVTGKLDVSRLARKQMGESASAARRASRPGVLSA